MKIVLAPDSFKGSMTALEVCDALQRGVCRILPGAELVALPMADGGEGTTAALVAACGGACIRVAASGPLPGQRQPVEGVIGLIHGGRTAVFEMACVSGLPLVPAARRNPLHTTSYGTGQMIAAALDRGARRLIVGIGGSATNDLGVGMAQALGIRFLRADGTELLEPITAERLVDVARIDPTGLHPAVAHSCIQVAFDVDNPLLGPQGCSAVYGPQKGASAADVTRLEAILAQAIDLIEATMDRRVRFRAGAGAAGGLGAGLMAFLGAELRPGIDLVLEASGFAEAIQGAQLVLTGEGRIDRQTSRGKTIRGVARLSQRQGVPVVAIVGSIGTGADLLYDDGLTSIISLVPGPVSLEDAMAQGPSMVADTAERVMRLFLAREIGAGPGG